MRLLSILLLASFITAAASAQTTPAYLDESLPVEGRVRDLVGRMTLEEKISQMRYDAPGVDRLGIPSYNWWNEALHGVARAGTATVFPQAIGMAATWNTDLMLRIATAISDEARAKHHRFVDMGRRNIYQGLTFWSPNINIFRDPRWGRGQETYGEDPYLTGRMAVSFIRGLQGDHPKYLKTVATSKHFAVHSGPESLRHSFDAQTNVRDLYQTYLPAFEMTIRDADVRSFMCAYNRYQGEAACGSSLLLGDILRGRWGFDGYVVSDCWAIRDFFEYHKVSPDAPSAAALAVQRGTDLNCGNTYAPHLAEAVRRGLLSEKDLDTALERLFEARFRLGMFDNPAGVPWTQIPYSVVNSEDHRQLALQAARESIVLLKNEGNLLPLKKELGSIAVIGPNADDARVLLANYNGTPRMLKTPLQGIREKISKDTRLYTAVGSYVADRAPLLRPIPSSALRPDLRNGDVHGLRGRYYKGAPMAGEPVIERVDPVLDFIWAEKTPVTGLMADSFSVVWTGSLVPPETGRYRLGTNAATTTRLFLDDSLRYEVEGFHHPLTRTFEVDLEGGRFYDLRIEYDNIGSDPQMHLLWAPPEAEAELRAEAVETARRADAVVLVMGINAELEGEEMPVKVEGFAGGDRTSLDIPATQVRLIQEIHALGKPTVLVLLNGSALSFPWAAEHLDAIVEAWYPGEAGGPALADVLFGDYNPGGRLPLTFYQSVDDLPPFEEYAMEGRTYRYFGGEPLYPFGYGLSYTRFAYADLKVSPARRRGAGPVRVSVQVTNAGNRPGDEVVQLYLRDIESTVPVPIRSLQGFRRVHLEPGETRTVEFTLEPKQYALVTDDGRRAVEPGVFEVSVGGEQPGFRGRADAATTEALTGGFRVTGRTVYIDP